MAIATQAPYELDPELLPFRSNATFPKQTEAHIRALAFKSQTEIHRLDSEISRTHALLHSLLVQHTQETERLSFLCGAISPLKQTPPEVLGHIFVLCGDGKPTVFPPNYPSTRGYPWVLGQVSSHWRKVLRATPAVWRNLEVGMIELETDHTIDIALDVLSRVGTGLRLSTRSDIDIDNPIGPFIFELASRLHHLSIQPTHAFLATFLGLPSTSLQVLESIEIQYDDLRRFSPPMSTTSLHTARNLTKVMFKHSGWGAQQCPPELLILPLGQLTEITFINLTIAYDEVHTILKQCGCLVTCTLALENRPQYRIAQPLCERVSLPTLRSLAITVSIPASFPWVDFFLPLNFPSLVNLSVSFADNLDDETLSSFLERSMCPLETLTWTTTHVQVDDRETFYPLLAYLQSIRELNIPNHCLPPVVFESLAQNGARSLPEIRRIVCCVTPLALDAFVDLVEQCMREGSTRMTSAELQCRSGVRFHEAFEKFHQLKHGWEMSGRMVSLRYYERQYEDEDYEYNYDSESISDDSDM